MQRLLIVDDNNEVRKQLKWGLSRSGYELSFARDGVEALKLFDKFNPTVVTLDLGLPPYENGTEEGVRCLSEMLRRNPVARVIVITGNEDHEAALNAVRIGAYDYYKKPIDLEELKIIIRRAMYLQSLEEENKNLREEKINDVGIIGESSAMLKIFDIIDRVAMSDVPVLVTGESGTGKELVAKAIHSKSLRSDKKMMSINCGAIPHDLLESELFGHEKGSFTGASQTKQGKVEAADKSTFFLDEIGEMDPSLQIKLLRFLQEMTITRVGGNDEIDVDVRILAATNIDIKKAVKDGSFREDLYYRIGVLNIDLPRLRDRTGDIELLANYFLKKYNVGLRATQKRFSSEALKAMNEYDWPGNVRELENRIKRAVVMSQGIEILLEDLDLKGAEKSRSLFKAGELNLKDAKALLEKNMCEITLEKFSGNIAKTAKVLGVSRPTFYDLIKRHGIKFNKGN